MARSGSEIVNPRTGQRTIFLQTAHDTANALLQMETYHAPQSPAEPEHTHPNQESWCEVFGGSLRFCINGGERIRQIGRGGKHSAGVPHYFWNDGEGEAPARQEFRPALNIEDFFVTYFALARDGKLNKDGLPTLLQLAVLMQAYDQAICMTRPPRLMQQLLLWTLGPLGRLLRYPSLYT